MCKDYIVASLKSKLYFVDDKWNVTGLENKVILCLSICDFLLYPYIDYLLCSNSRSAIFTYNATLLYSIIFVFFSHKSYLHFTNNVLCIHIY